MTWLRNLELIRFLEFYLVAIFLLSTALRLRQYQIVLALVRHLPGRWPRLLALLKQHHGIFFTRATFLPAAIALALWLAHTLACRLVWPHARLTVGDLFELRFAWPVVFVLGAAMIGFDLYTLFKVGKLDRAQIETYFDMAEYWLRSWTTPVVKAFTFGFVNPHQIVAGEVQKALLEVNKLLNSTLWWVSVQTGLRIAYGLALWLTFAFAHGLTAGEPQALHRPGPDRLPVLLSQQHPIRWPIRTETRCFLFQGSVDGTDQEHPPR
jgi:hypothetical protein